MSTEKDKGIAYGDQDILGEEELSPKNVKERITTMVDQDVLDVIRKRAAAEGIGYQTLINRALRDEFLGGPKVVISDVIAEWKRDIETRVRDLERSGGKQKSKLKDMMTSISTSRSKSGTYKHRHSKRKTV